VLQRDPPHHCLLPHLPALLLLLLWLLLVPEHDAYCAQRN
jgi:hypothetical protein